MVVNCVPHGDESGVVRKRLNDIFSENETLTPCGVAHVCSPVAAEAVKLVGKEGPEVVRIRPGDRLHSRNSILFEGGGTCAGEKRGSRLGNGKVFVIVKWIIHHSSDCLFIRTRRCGSETGNGLYFRSHMPCEPWVTSMALHPRLGTHRR